MVAMARWFTSYGQPFLAATLALAAPLMSGEARAASPVNVFTVANYPVQARAADAVTAKAQALAEGQQRAFRSLMKRLVPVSAYPRLPQVQLVRIQDMITGFSVRQEQNSSTEYVASLDFEFEPKAVRELLRSEGLPFVEEAAPPTVIVPIYAATNSGKLPAHLQAAQAAPTWRKVWSDIDLDHALTPLRVSQSADRVHPDTVRGLLAGDEGMVRTLAAENQTERVVLLHAEPSPDGKAIQVTLAGRDAVGPMNLRRTYRIHDNDVSYTSELAAVVSLGILEGRWKAVKTGSAGGIVTGGVGASSWSTSVDRGGGVSAAWPSPGVRAGAGGDTVRMTVEFRGLNQWSAIRQRLVGTPGVEDLEVSQMTARGAYVTLRYPGGAPQLADDLRGVGLELMDQAGQWVLQPR
jgi:hypothetical protein